MSKGKCWACTLVATCRVVCTVTPPLLRLGLIDRSTCVVLGAVIGLVVALRSMSFRPH